MWLLGAAEEFLAVVDFVLPGCASVTLLHFVAVAGIAAVYLGNFFVMFLLKAVAVAVAAVGFVVAAEDSISAFGKFLLESLVVVAGSVVFVFPGSVMFVFVVVVASLY